MQIPFHFKGDKLKAIWFKNGEVLFHEGSKYRGIYYICKGNVLITKNAPINSALECFGPGDFVGLTTIEGKNQYDATAIAKDLVRVLLLNKEKFDSLVGQSKAFQKKVFAKIIDNINDAEEKICSYPQNSVEARFLEYIKKETIKSARKKFVIGDVAIQIGTDKGYLRRLLRGYIENEALTLSGSTIIIQNKKRLFTSQGKKRTTKSY